MHIFWQRDKSAVGCKWVLKAKYMDDGNRFMRRLAAKGHSQVPDVSLVVKYSHV